MWELTQWNLRIAPLEGIRGLPLTIHKRHIKRAAPDGAGPARCEACAAGSNRGSALAAGRSASARCRKRPMVALGRGAPTRPPCSRTWPVILRLHLADDVLKYQSGRLPVPPCHLAAFCPLGRELGLHLMVSHVAMATVVAFHLQRLLKGRRRRQAVKQASFLAAGNFKIAYPFVEGLSA